MNFVRQLVWLHIQSISTYTKVEQHPSHLYVGDVAQLHVYVLGPLKDASLSSYFGPFDGRITLFNTGNVELEKLV